MGERKPTEGLQGRLNWALKRGPRAMHVRELGAKLREAHPNLRGTSDSGVRLYATRRIANPRMELVRAMADVLGVRWRKLAYDEGEWTEGGEQVRVAAATMTAVGTSQGIIVRDPKSLPEYVDELARDMVNSILQAINNTLGLKKPSDAPPWSSGVIEVWKRLTVSTPLGAHPPQQSIANALRAPLDALGVSADKMHQKGDLTLYVAAMIPALMILANERERDLFSEEDEDHWDDMDWYYNSFEGQAKKEEEADDA